MSSHPARSLRRERRAAAIAQRRREPRRVAHEPRRIGIGLVSLIGLAAGILVIGVLILQGSRSTPTAVSVARASAPAGIPVHGDVLGNTEAPITIDLYEDFQCPACQRWGTDVFPSIVRNELAAGTVKIAFHSFAFIGPESETAGRAAWAAARQDRFWDMWATIYANQGTRENDGSFRRERLIAMAGVLGLDLVRFSADLDSADAAAWVADGVAGAAAAGVNSTPTLLIDGVPLPGSGYADVSAAIAAALAR
jgi:protein-disulfide isomerase